MPGRVDEVQIVDLPVPGLVAQGRGLGLDRDPALALEVHRVEHLLFHFAFGKTTAIVDQAVGQRGLAMIDVGDDRKISDLLQSRYRRVKPKRTGRVGRAAPVQEGADDDRTAKALDGRSRRRIIP